VRAFALVADVAAEAKAKAKVFGGAFSGSEVSAVAVGGVKECPKPLCLRAR